MAISHDDVIKWKTFYALLAICAGNSPVTGEFPAERPVNRSFDVFFDLRLHKSLSKQWWGWWFETLSRTLWRHCNVTVLVAVGPPRFQRWHNLVCRAILTNDVSSLGLWFGVDLDPCLTFPCSGFSLCPATICDAPNYASMYVYPWQKWNIECVLYLTTLCYYAICLSPWDQVYYWGLWLLEH